MDTGPCGDQVRDRWDHFTHSAVGLSVPLDEEAGAVPDDHPLQMGRHDEPGENKSMCHWNSLLANDAVGTYICYV